MPELTIEVLKKKVLELHHARWNTNTCENCGQSSGYTFSAGFVYSVSRCKCDDTYQEPKEVSWKTLLADLQSRITDPVTIQYWKL